MTRIACQQLAPRFGDVEANRSLTVGAIDEAVEAGAEIVVLPELITSGYMFASRAEAAEAAITLEHPLLADWAERAARHDVVIVGGVCERAEDGLIHNSAVAIDASGLRAVYRKLHLWDREKLAFVPGDAPPPVFDTRHGRLSLLICYDLEFPELTRSVALAGAQLLVVPTNWPLVPRPAGERPPEALIAMTTARINRMAVACADRVGPERGQEWTGGSTIVDVDGWVAAETREPGLLLADIDLDAALEKRLSEHADVFGDRRPALYHALVDPREDPAHG
jgi:predicted amidohydrolase